MFLFVCFFFFFQAEDGIRDLTVTGVQTCALPIFHFLRLDRQDALDAVRRLHGELDAHADPAGLRRTGDVRVLRGRGAELGRRRVAALDLPLPICGRRDVQDGPDPVVAASGGGGLLRGRRGGGRRF